VVRVRAEAAAATTATPATAAKHQEHEELKRYGVFKLAYDTSNVSVGASRPLPFRRPLLTVAERCFDRLSLWLQEDPSLTKAWQKTVKVAVTGASGQISNHLLFMVSLGLHACISGCLSTNQHARSVMRTFMRVMHGLSCPYAWIRCPRSDAAHMVPANLYYTSPTHLQLFLLQQCTSFTKL
jgi:hypothetical protein